MLKRTNERRQILWLVMEETRDGRFNLLTRLPACLLFPEPGRGKRRTAFPLLLCISIRRLISFRPFAVSSAIRRREEEGGFASSADSDVNWIIHRKILQDSKNVD